jgi:hypothetical protein
LNKATLGNIGMKKRSSSIQRSMVEATERSTSKLVASLDKIHETNVVIEKKRSHMQKELLHKELQYFK